MTDLPTWLMVILAVAGVLGFGPLIGVFLGHTLERRGAERQRKLARVEAQTDRALEEIGLALDWIIAIKSESWSEFDRDAIEEASQGYSARLNQLETSLVTVGALLPDRETGRQVWRLKAEMRAVFDVAEQLFRAVWYLARDLDGPLAALARSAEEAEETAERILSALHDQVG